VVAMSNPTPRKAVIFAGGKGTRLAPFTTVLPKPLVPVGDLPILEIMLRQLVHHGVKDVVIAVGHLSSLIRAYFENHPLTRVLNITYHQETVPLGTAGAIAVMDGLDAPFLAMNGDVLTTLDYSELMRLHVERNAALTIAVTRKRVQIELGVLQLNQDNQVVGYDEKPVKEYPASMGIYAYHPRIKQYMTKDTYLDVPTLVLRLIAEGEIVQAYMPEAFWLDMGNRGDLELAVAAFEADRGAFLPDGPDPA
jgi:NDP-sugar pyrophosphorylase family protein